MGNIFDCENFSNKVTKISFRYIHFMSSKIIFLQKWRYISIPTIFNCIFHHEFIQNLSLRNSQSYGYEKQLLNWIFLMDFGCFQALFQYFMYPFYCVGVVTYSKVGDWSGRKSGTIVKGLNYFLKGEC